MRQQLKEPLEYLLTDEPDFQQDLKSFSMSLSSTGKAPESDIFWSTIDRLQFKSLEKITSEVLKAHGYVANFENILACLDFFQFGVKARLKEAPTEEDQKLKVREILPAVIFKLPSKTTQGNLLGLFYNELDAYESEISELRSRASEATSKVTKKENEQLKKQLKNAQDESDSLKAKVEELSIRLNELKHSHASAEKALASQNLMPEHLRIGKVREIDFASRKIFFRTGRSALEASTALLNSIPEIDEECILHVENRKIRGILVLDPDAKPVEMVSARVLHKEKNIIKVMDLKRQIHEITCQSDTELELLKRVKRHDRLIIKVFGPHVIQILLSPSINESLFTTLVHDQNTVKQLEDEYQKSALQKLLEVKENEWKV